MNNQPKLVSQVYTRQIGQTSTEEVKKRDLRAELLAAEQEALNKKRKAEGKPPLPIEGSQDEEANKRRKLLQEALEMDKDDEDDEGDDKKSQKEDGTDRSVAACVLQLPFNLLISCL